MSLVLEFAKAVTEADEIGRKLLVAEAPDETLRDALFKLRTESSRIAADIVNTPYSDESSSDYQLLRRNAFFRKTIAMAAYGHEAGEKIRAKMSPAKAAVIIKDLREATTSKKGLQNSYKIKDMGLEQLSEDLSFRKLVAENAFDWMARIDQSSERDRESPSFDDLDDEQKQDYVRAMIADQEQGKGSLAFRFLMAVAPKFTTNVVAFMVNTAREKASDDLLTKLKAREPVATPG